MYVNSTLFAFLISQMALVIGRDETYLKLAIQYTTAVVMDSQILNLFPSFIKSYVINDPPIARTSR